MVRDTPGGEMSPPMHPPANYRPEALTNGDGSSSEERRREGEKLLLGGMEKKTPTCPIVPASDFLDSPPPSSYLIKEILPRRGLAQLFGASNVGKSFLALDMAESIISGRDWHGAKTHQGPVLYIASEGLSGLHLRLKALSIATGTRLPGLHIHPLPVHLTETSSLTRLIANIAATINPSPVCLIIDTLHGNFGAGSENDVEAMSAAVSSLRGLARKGDWLVLTVHHAGHQEKGRSRGHSSLTAALDVEIRAESKGGTIEVCHTKARDFERMTPKFLRLKSVETGWHDEDNCPLTSAVVVEAEIPDPGPAKLGPLQEQALDKLREAASQAGSETIALAAALASLSGPPSRRERMLQSLDRNGAIRIQGDEISVSL